MGIYGIFLITGNAGFYIMNRRVPECGTSGVPEFGRGFEVWSLGCRV